MSESMSASQAGAEHHPIGLIVTDDLRRNRLTVFFRLVLAIPHVIFLALWGIVVYLAAIVAWFAAVFTGRVPDGLHGFMATYLRYTTRVFGYLYLLAGPETQSRLTVGFRIILAIPALILSGVFQMVNRIVAFLGWFYCLATGNMNEGMRNISAWLLRYEIQTYAYLFLLTEKYPSLSGAPTA